MERQLAENDFCILHIIPALARRAELPFHCQDPFDRLPIAQAVAADIAVVSADVAFDPYPVRRQW